MTRLWIACLLLAPLLASADERILSFHSDILVRADGVLEVTETIRIRAGGGFSGVGGGGGGVGGW